MSRWNQLFELCRGGASVPALSILVLIPVLIGLTTGCGSSGKFRIPEPVPNDQRAGPEPESRDINIIADGFDQQFIVQIEQSFDLSRQLRNLFGRPKRSINVDAFGEVINSSWFTNRNSLKRVSIEEIARGPNSGETPDTSGVWTVIRAKAEGVTPGFHIEDSHGVRYVIKFDPADYPELATGAEIVSTKLFYALGYNVPENYIVYFEPKILRLGEKVKFTDEKGRKRFMTREDLDAILERIERLRDGSIRAAASKYLAGGLKGPFKYKSTRKDDPNDVIPHQHRRELRGLRVIAAWLNHFDTKANNSLDVYVKEGYMKHYLIDFGSTLGSQGNEPMPPEIGHENTFDPHEIFKNIVTLGLYVHPWEKVEPIRYPSIGYFRSDIFHPQKYKGIFPNPAFENMTHQDGYWGAKQVMSFTDEQIKAAVAEGQYSNPEAPDFLLQIIIERRDIVGRYWFSRVNPLDKFELQETSDGKQELCFVDIGVESGLESAEQSEYRYDLRREGTLVRESKSFKETCIPLSEINPTTAPTEGLWELKLRTKRGTDGKWMKPVKVYLRSDDASKTFALVGVRH